MSIYSSCTCAKLIINNWICNANTVFSFKVTQIHEVVAATVAQAEKNTIIYLNGDNNNFSNKNYNKVIVSNLYNTVSCFGKLIAFCDGDGDEFTHANSIHV